MTAELFGLANCDHDGDHFEFVFTDRDMAQRVADKLNARREHYYRLEIVTLPLIADESDPRLADDADCPWYLP